MHGRPFRVGITPSARAADGTFALAPDGLAPLLAAGAECVYLAPGDGVVAAADLAGKDALMAIRAAVPAEALAVPGLLVVARLGSGLESVDLEAATANGVVVTHTPDAVAEPMAHAAMAFVLALTHRLTAKDRLIREGRWRERDDERAVGLRGRTMGIVGLGSIGRALASLARAFGLTVFATSPSLTDDLAARSGAVRVDLAELLARSDIVVLCCPLTAATRSLMDAAAIARMPRGSFLVNIARGPVVDQGALVEALRSDHLGGAALDVFATEPLAADDPLLALPNVIVAPHTIGHTDTLFSEITASACRSVLAVMRGEIPDHVANPEVLSSPALRLR